MPEVIVLDTHLWLWLVNANFDRFPVDWRDQIELATRVGVSPISCYEIALAHQKGRIRLPASAEEWCTEALAPVGIELLPVTVEIATQAVSLSPVHKDPFDRLIIATALVYKARLASVDGVFKQYAELKDTLM